MPKTRNKVNAVAKTVTLHIGKLNGEVLDIAAPAAASIADVTQSIRRRLGIARQHRIMLVCGTQVLNNMQLVSTLSDYSLNLMQGTQGNTDLKYWEDSWDHDCVLALDGVRELMQDYTIHTSEEITPYIERIEDMYVAQKDEMTSAQKFQVLQFALGLGNAEGGFLGSDLVEEVRKSNVGRKRFDVNKIDSNGRSLFSACIHGSDESGTLVYWDAVALLASNFRFAALDLIPDNYPILGPETAVHIDSLTLLDLINRNQASKKQKLRDTVNFKFDLGFGFCGKTTLLQLVCGARGDHFQGELEGSAEVVTAILDHSDFKLVNYANRQGHTALHILCSTSGSDNQTQGVQSGHHSFRHLSMEDKVQCIGAFLDHEARHPGTINFGLKCDEERATAFDLARKNRFPGTILARLKKFTKKPPKASKKESTERIGIKKKSAMRKVKKIMKKVAIVKRKPLAK